jgi:phosphoglycolate phosphatase-like HAD superfamily hydrolase
MSDPATILKELQPRKGFFIGIDSDGCAFDTMEIKQKECFCPNFIRHFGLQAASKYARETWEFVNLYSKDRGCNRFLAVVRALDLLRERPEVKARGVKIPRVEALRSWLKRETKLGNPALKAELERVPDPELRMIYGWSLDVNEAIERMVKGVPPFPLVRESLELMRASADVMVVSQTPGEALVREWKEHAIDGYVRVIAGQEMGTKAQHITFAALGKYPANRILMIGDAPGDYQAAKANNACFFPIVPGREELSWKQFHDEALDRFLGERYQGSYEQDLLKAFDASLPATPSWEATR